MVGSLRDVLTRLPIDHLAPVIRFTQCQGHAVSEDCAMEHSVGHESLCEVRWTPYTTLHYT